MKKFSAYKVSALALMALFVSSPARAQDQAALCKLWSAAQPPVAGAAYQPGVDASGHAVVPADVSNAMGGADVIRLPLSLDLAKQLNAGLPQGASLPATSMIEIHKDGKVVMNGQDLTGATQSLCAHPAPIATPQPEGKSGSEPDITDKPAPKTHSKASAKHTDTDADADAAATAAAAAAAEEAVNGKGAAAPAPAAQPAPVPAVAAQPAPPQQTALPPAAQPAPAAAAPVPQPAPATQPAPAPATQPAVQTMPPPVPQPQSQAMPVPAPGTQSAPPPPDSSMKATPDDMKWSQDQKAAHDSAGSENGQ